ncbi:hypothetical protein L916_15181 [Phytophthora nicotianae]|uniref:Uncharacterized protein n=1 Tax=Phytophthora nicotianae TaxID=4792 RepID=W2IDG2_PHYNI|nr:hypothetical protein L916_15181 [Phytophthora nicotianae]
MADRSQLWGGRSSRMRQTTELSGRRRHDQQRLLVELELDDSLYQGAIRAGAELYPGGRRSSAGDSHHRRQVHPYAIAEPKPRLQARSTRDATTKPLSERQMHQVHARRLASPYKLKQQVLGSRNDSMAQRSQQSTQRVMRSSLLEQSPAQLVIESVRQNIHLRDQVLAHLQQELMGVLPLHRASHVEKNVPQRVVKLLNRMRSLSLAVVEAVVYLSSELGASSIINKSFENEILEQDFYGYLLQMASSDTDFLACSPQLQRFFEDFDVSLARNPFLDGLSLDSSEVLLCACHQSPSSGGLFCSASSSSSSLLRLLTHKLETFALQTQRYLPGWQVLPAQRVAAALLHLMDLETRSKAVQMLPRYLQSHSGYRSHLQKHIQQHGPDETSHNYGTFEDDRIRRWDQRRDRRNDEPPRRELSVMEAWTGPAEANVALPSDVRSRVPAPKMPSEDSVRGTSNKAGWIQLPSPKNPGAVKSDSPASNRTPAATDSTGVADTNVEHTRLVPPLNMAAMAKSSSRSNSSEKSASKKKSRIAKASVVDAGIQMSQPNTPTAAATQTSSRSVRSTSEWSVHDEGNRSEMKPSIQVIGNTDSRRDANVPASNGEDLDHEEAEALPVVDPLALPRDTVERRLSRLVSAMETPATDPQVECEAEGIREAETTDDKGYECDFEYSSNSALSSIAMALQMLPNFSLSTAESPRADEVLAPEEAIPLIEPVSVQSSETDGHGSAVIDSTGVLIASAAQLIDRGRSSLLELGISLGNSRTEPESVDQRVGAPPSVDDEFAYSSTIALSNIAMALSLLPGVSRDDIFSVPEAHDTDSLSTYRSIVSRLEEPNIEDSMEEIPNHHSSLSARSNISVEINDQPILLLPFSSHNYELASDRTANSSPISSRSNSSVTTQDRAMNLPPASSRTHLPASSHQDSESEGSGLNRIFSLCRDIQVAAIDMSHWVSQREVENHIQSVAQPYSSLMGYSSPTANTKTDNAPKYLERELKMLRRNLTSWKSWVIDHKRAKLIVRRLVARRKVRQFVRHHYRRRVQARIDQEIRCRFVAVLRIQRNWMIYSHNLQISRRKADFCALHLAFYRTLFFVGISRRRRRREDAKERIVRWWRHQRFRIKKKKQRQEKLLRERERRVRALRDIQKFLKEILLRRKLKATQEMAKKILFKEQLKWTKAKRNMERNMRLDSKHRIELIADMNARFADLDHKWKASEYERLLLLTHHERVVQQQQQAVEVRKRRLAALKIQMFFRVCVLHEKLQRVEMEKKEYELKFKNELLTKEKLDVESQQRIGKIRTQVRVLERKINRMAREATQTDASHRQVVQSHQERERISQERAARQKIKALIEARTLSRRAERERRSLLLNQARLLAEKTESEFMSSEDQLEQRRSAVSIASGLKQRLSEMETRSQALQAARDQLAAEKEKEARQAVEALEHGRVQASMHLIASWVSGQVLLSKLHKEKAAISALAVQELEQEKQKQRQAIEAKNSEISSIKASNFMHQRINQQRNNKTVEMIRIQHKQKAALEKSIAERTRAQLVQIIIDVKLLTERETSRGIAQGVASVTQFYKAQLHKFARLEHLRNVSCARKIQRVWRQWRRIKRAQELELAQLEENKRRWVLARRIQLWWRKWLQRRQEQQRVFNAHLEAIRVRANARKIQGMWRRWIRRERERKLQEQLAFDAHLDAICIRANARKIQGVWRRWVKREQERRRVFYEHLKGIRQRASACKIQAAWRRWIQGERARRHVQRLAFEAQLKVLRIAANARKIQRVWRSWVKFDCERRQQQQLEFNEHLISIRERANVRKIQRVWRKWAEKKKKLREQRRARRLVFSSVLRIQRWWRKWRKKQRVKATRTRIMHNACAQVIQKQWRRWHRSRIAKRERQRLRIQRKHCVRKLQRCWRQWIDWKHRREESAKRIQTRWEKWQKHKAEVERVRNEQKMAVEQIQRNWRQWLCRRQYMENKTRKQKEKREILAVGRIQNVWRRYRQRLLKKAEREQQEKEERAVALRIQQNWTGKLFRKNKQEAERKRHLGARRIQGNWRRWQCQKEAKRDRQRAVENQRVSAMKLQRRWKNWHLSRQEQERRVQEQECRTAAVLIIQSQWRTHHATVLKTIEEEISQQDDEHLRQENVANALKIQTFWRNKRKQLDKQRESEQVRQTRNTSSLTIQRNWGIRQHRRKMDRQRIQHEQHMAALKIQTRWLTWHHEQQEELERERIQQEQDESCLKIQRSWVISHQRRKVVQERLRHKQNLNALKIQKHWRRWRHLRLEQRTRSIGDDTQKPRNSVTTEPQHDSKQAGNDLERQQKVENITQRSCGRCIVRAVKRYHQSQREARAATKIEAIWKGWLYRSQYLQAIEAKHAEEVRQYQLMISVLATKVQVCWRQWNVGVRQAKRAAVKSEELRLIQEAKALERKLIAAKRTLAAKRIQRALVSRRRLIATTGVSHREVVEKKDVDEPEKTIDKVDEHEPVDQHHNEEPARDFQEPTEFQNDASDYQESIKESEEEVIRSTVELTVEDWSHRQLPHILSRSVNQIIFCHEAATVLQKCVRGYLRRQRMQFYLQHSFSNSDADNETKNEHFHFYFKRARAWLDWNVVKSTHFAELLPETNQNTSFFRLRFDRQITRKLLQLFEPSEDYLASEIQQVLQELTIDALPIFKSPVCFEDNTNPRSELRYHDVKQNELPLSVQLLQQMKQQRAHIRLQQILGVDTNADEPSASSPVPASPTSPSRAKKEVTLFTAVDHASLEDATFLQQRGADLGALEPKTQRNALHLLSFSKENHRSRAEVLNFLLTCGTYLNVNAVDCNGDTPLMLYASLGHLEFMQKLLQHGADIQMTNNEGQNVLHRACEEDQVEVCGFLQQLMLKDSIAEDILPVGTINSLVPSALNLHSPDISGRYPLHYLAEKGFVECAKQLIVPTEANVEWNRLLQAQGDAEGRTALHLAVLAHDVAMTVFLLTPGGVSDVNAFDDLHRSPVHYAVESPAALAIIARLVQHGANVNVADERGDTPLHWAAFSGRAAVIQNLLALGADPTLSNNDWETPAQIAAAYGQLDCMRLLLQAQRRFGAEPREEEQNLKRLASEKTALERLEEAVNELHQRQASMHSRPADQDELEAPVPGGYWEELHQDVQLVEESGQFSSEDEQDFLLDN